MCPDIISQERVNGHYLCTPTRPIKKTGQALPLSSGGFEAAPLLRVPRLEDVLGRSLLLSKLWKKFCSTSCCVWPGGGLLAPTGDAVWRPGGDAVLEPSGDGRPVAPVRLAKRRAAVESAAPVGPPESNSISDNARSTVGRLKLLLPNGPTIPAAAFSRSAGLRNAPLGSRSGFLEFSS